jgi:hypothetical protein
MANIEINNLNREIQIVSLNKQQTSNIFGASWHIYHNSDGQIIGREYEKDGINDVIHHRPK